MNRTDITDQDVLNAWNQQLSLRGAADVLGCSVDLVRRRLQRLDVTVSHSKGASRHYDTLADDKWSEIKSDLDAGKDIKYLGKEYHMTKSRLEALFERQGFDYCAWQGKQDAKFGLELKSYRDAGMSIAEICEKLNKSESTVNRYLKKYSLTSKSDRDDVTEDDVLDLWNQGYSMSEISEQLSCSVDTVSERLDNLGIVHDKVSGIHKHFDRVHADMWPDIKLDLDLMLPISLVCKNHHVTYDTVHDLIQKNKYQRPSGIKLNLDLWNMMMHKASDTEAKYLQAVYDYYLEYGVVPSVKVLAQRMNRAFSTVNDYVNQYALHVFIDNSDSCGIVTRLKHDLTRLGIRYETNNRRILKHNGVCMEMDFWLPDLKLGIEANPTGMHSIDSLYGSIHDKGYNQVKSLCAEEYSIGLLHLYDFDMVNGVYDKIMYMLRYKVSGQIRIGARKCIVKQLAGSECKKFLDQYHLQGAEKSACVRFGLYFNDTLVSVLCIGRPRYSEHDYEIIRYCIHPKYVVSGGFGKLFHAFLDTVNKPVTVVSYMDLNKRFCSENIYEKHGFELESVTQPDYVWVKRDGGYMLKRYQTTKKKLVAKGFDKDLTEIDIMKMRGYYRVFGAGSKRYVYQSV